MSFRSVTLASLRASFWFTPAWIVLASMAAAAAMVEVDAWQSADLAAWSPRLFGAGADGSRAMLSAIATSMATVAGVVFSITIVTLSLASTQYSPRVLRNFMRDTPTQVVLGIFVGIFAYCLVVLRAIRGGDEGVFIPSLAVLGGLAYAFVGVAVLIYFIHHVAVGIQASTILERIAADTGAAIERLFPQEMGAARDEAAGPIVLPSRWHPVPSTASGYIVSVDATGLLALARESSRVLRIDRPVGAFVAEQQVVAAVSGGEPPGEELVRRLRGCIVVGSHRTVEQDAAFGLQQLVDVALRALSPGINDPTTACMCIDRIGALLAQLARRHIPDALRHADGELRVIAPAPDFGQLAGDALDPLLRHARGDVQVLSRILAAIETVGCAHPAVDRRGPLLPRLQLLRIAAAQVRPRASIGDLLRRIAAVERRLRGVHGPGAGIAQHGRLPRAPSAGRPPARPARLRAPARR